MLRGSVGVRLSCLRDARGYDIISHNEIEIGTPNGISKTFDINQVRQGYDEGEKCSIVGGCVPVDGI